MFKKVIISNNLLFKIIDLAKIIISRNRLLMYGGKNMALINCPECGKEVSDSAVYCPNCGFGVVTYIKKQKEIAQLEIQAKNNYNSNTLCKVLEAKKLYKSMNKYIDSSEMIIKCENKIKELEEEQDKLIKTELERKKKQRKKNAIICLVAVFVTIVLVASGIVINNYIKVQNIKNSIENDMKSKLWENAFDTVIQSELSEQEKKDYFKKITPPMKQSAEDNKYNNFLLRNNYLDLFYYNTLDHEKTNDHSHSLKIIYNNGKEKVFYEAKDSARYEKTWYNNKTWVSGTQEWLGSMIYGNGTILFEVSSLTAYSKDTPLVSEIICYKYNINNDELKELFRKEKEDTEIDFTKLQDGNILIEENNNKHIYNPYSDTFRENVTITDEEVDSKAIYSRNHIKYL